MIDPRRLGAAVIGLGDTLHWTQIRPGSHSGVSTVVAVSASEVSFVADGHACSMPRQGWEGGVVVGPGRARWSGVALMVNSVTARASEQP